MERIDSCLIALRRILRATEQFGRSLAQSAGLTAAQFRVLQIAAEHDACTATRIAQQMHVSQATITSLVDKLVAKGNVERIKSQTDRRQTHIELTDKGRATLDAAPDALQQQFVAAFDALQDWEQSMLVASLERVAAMLNAEDLDASPVLDTGDIGRGA